MVLSTAESREVKDEDNDGGSDNDNEKEDRDGGKDLLETKGEENSSSSSSTSSISAYKSSSVIVDNHRNDRRKKKEKKMRRMVDEGSMRGVCDNIFNALRLPHTVEISSSVIFGLRKEGGANE